VALGAGALAASLSAPAAAQPKQVAASWDVLGVGPQGRSLELVYITGGCLSPTAQTAVAQTNTTVTLTVTLTDEATPGTACPDYLRYATTSVALPSPLAGRAILGRPTPALSGYSGTLVTVNGHLELRLPRLVGFAPADALHTVALHGLRERVVRTTARRGLLRVIAQAPSPGALVAARSTVLVTLSRRS
jgi:hypothetical protein